jgi:hypothetical protein
MWKLTRRASAPEEEPKNPLEISGHELIRRLFFSSRMINYQPEIFFIVRTMTQINL